MLLAVALLLGQLAINLVKPCRLYIAPSKIPGAGRGIIAGRRFEKGDVLEIAPTFTLLCNHSDRTALSNYVFAAEATHYAVVLLGSGSLYNFVLSAVSVKHHWASSSLYNADQGNFPYTNMTQSRFVAASDLGDGEELFLDYGELWIRDRGWNFMQYSQSPPPPYTFSELKAVGVCLTDVSVAVSTIPAAGRGLFASRDFKEGDLVIASPVLVLPMDVVRESKNSSVLMNYVWTEADSLVGLLPLTNLAMINHPAHGNQDLNMFMTWYDWNDSQLDETLTLSLKEILAVTVAPLDVALYAGRDIKAGEELFVDYGSTWVKARSMFVAMGQQGQFRQTMTLPSAFLPRQWKVDYEEFSEL